MSAPPTIFPTDYVMAEVGVFWDIEDCPNPDGIAKGVEIIKKRISDVGHRGLVTIRAYGDMKDYDFASLGVKPNHVPAGEIFARHTKILEDIASWAAETPPPASYMLIVGNNISNDFLEFVQLLKSKNYMCLLVHP